MQKQYERVFEQLRELFQKTKNPLARMATAAALLFHKMPGYSWCGFYLLTDGELLVGPYQGPLACLLLEKNIGVCWTGIRERKTIVVPDVHKFPGHIACNPANNSEIVVPLFRGEDVVGVLDVDSRAHGRFTEIDAQCLEKIVSLIS